jgi:peptide/nickel transport system permease protein
MTDGFPDQGGASAAVPLTAAADLATGDDAATSSSQALLDGEAAAGASVGLRGERSAIRQDASWRMIVRAFVENKLALVGLIMVVAVALFCFVGPLLWHTNQINTNLFLVNKSPSAAHPLGTDDLGYDVLGRLMAGGQSSLEVGLAVALAATGIGVLYGVISGFAGGITDAVLMRFVDIILAIPVVYLFIDLASEFKPTLLLLILVLSLLSWMGPARLVRGETLSLRVREFVEAVKTMGGRSGRIIARHLVPNTMGTIAVNATFQVADAILTLAVLSYLGFSLPPPTATWGGMLENGVNFLYDGYWWEIYPAGVLIVLTVVAFNFIGDGLRDSLDVRLQRR